MPIKCTINGQDFNIKNQDEINFDFQVNGDSPNVTFTQEFGLEFVDELHNSPIAALDNILFTYGLLEDIPCDLFDDLGNKFEGRLLPGSSSSEYSNNPTVYRILWRPSKYKFFEKARSLSVNLLLNQSDYKKVRYIVEGKTSYIESVLIAYAAYSMARAAIVQFFATIQATKELIAALTPDGAVPLPDFLKAAVLASFNALLQAGILALEVYALNELLKQISDSLFQKPKALYCVNVLDVIKKGCNDLGYDFKCTELETTYKDLTYLAATDQEGELRSNPKNKPVPKISLLDFIDKFALLFNGKIKEVDNVITLEPKEEYLDKQPQNIQLNDIYKEGTFSFNTDELVQKISISYLNAPSDGQFNKDSIDVAFESKRVPNKDLSINNSLDVQLPFILANHKKGTSDLERFFNSIFDLFVGLNSRYKVRGGDRKDFMLLEHDIVPADLLFIYKNNEKVRSNTKTLLGVDTLFNNFYEKEAPYHNQYKIYKQREDQRPLTIQNNFLLADNNNIKDSDGRIIHVTKSSYDHMRRISNLEYRKKLQPGDFGYINKDDFKIKITL